MNKSVVNELEFHFYRELNLYFIWQIKYKYEDKDAINEYHENFMAVDIFQSFWYGEISISTLNDYWEKFISRKKLNTEDEIYFLERLIKHLEYKKEYEELIEKYSFAECTIFDLDTTCSYCRFIDYFESQLEKLNTIQTNTSQPFANEFPILSWSSKRGAKTDLSELIYVLAQSKMILKEGKPIPHNALTKIFNELLGTDISLSKPTELMGDRTIDKTFITELHRLMNEQISK